MVRPRTDSPAVWPPHELGLEFLRRLEDLPSPEREAVLLHRVFGLHPVRIAELLDLDLLELNAFLAGPEAHFVADRRSATAPRRWSSRGGAPLRSGPYSLG